MGRRLSMPHTYTFEPFMITINEGKVEIKNISEEPVTIIEATAYYFYKAVTPDHKIIRMKGSEKIADHKELKPGEGIEANLEVPVIGVSIVAYYKGEIIRREIELEV
ncbi:hypothetical protein IPA_04980 [Ignicoccus pacificus DSM 13166]|uniref:Uncharacterized protein n=1 Tax=Ignicoccus pacificus DSM 13166 TaxID=940294 RepID=A0A977PKY2_9CREN|nr:hypothetical protein IPA_04980 [Ignicoccus pacificus DSM 13166]